MRSSGRKPVAARCLERLRNQGVLPRNSGCPRFLGVFDFRGGILGCLGQVCRPYRVSRILVRKGGSCFPLVRFGALGWLGQVF